MDEQENLDPEEMTNQPLAYDAVPLCPNCLQPCNPLDNYCPNCDSNEAINPLASYMPFESIRFKAGMFGKLWHKTWAKETGRLDRGIYIGLSILFYPIILIIGVPYILYERIKRSRWKSAISNTNDQH